MAQAQPNTVVEEGPLSIRLETYAADHDRAERADPSLQMNQRSEIRNRGLGSRNAPADENSLSATAQQTNTGIAREQEQAQGMKIAN